MNTKNVMIPFKRPFGSCYLAFAVGILCHVSALLSAFH